MIEDCTTIESAARSVDDHPGPKTGANRLLSALTLPPTHSDFRKLRQAVSRHRIVILRRGAVIAVTTLVSVGGALFLHAMFAGVFMFGMFFPWSHQQGDGKSTIGIPDNGGSPVAFIPGDSESSGGGTPAGAKEVLGSPDAGSPVTTALPDLPDRAVAAEPIAFSPTLPDVIAPDVLGSVKVNTPPTVSKNIAEQVVQASRSNPGGTAGTAAAIAGAGIGDVAKGGFGDEPVFGFGQRGGTGTGRGSGNGVGNGNNRGMSAANRDPQILNPPAKDNPFTVPLEYQLKPPEKDVELLITVLADGSIGDIKLAQSCGIPKLDDLVREYAFTYLRFSPAYRDGKAVTSTFEYGHSFRPFD